MKIAGLISLIVLGCMSKTQAWGFFGHQVINRMACFTLPAALFSFYKSHIDYITAHAIDPDKKRYSDPNEAPRHFIDLDHYGQSPFDSIPERWKDAKEKFSEDTLVKYGIVPWHINNVFFKLKHAFLEKDLDRILYYSATIGHYIADSHVPLHCTKNYNGQFTNQHGIHGFWESRLPELFCDDYDFLLGRATYVEDVQLFCWQTLRESFAALDSVLNFERVLNIEFETDKKYAFETRGNQLVRTYSKEYSEAYHEVLDGQVERRMQKSILAVGSIWLTAWVDAGMPVLPDNSEGKEQVITPPEEQTDSTSVNKSRTDCD